MPSFYRSTVRDLLSVSAEGLLARLTVAYANSGFTRQYSEQTLTWERDLESLRTTLAQCVRQLPRALDWGVLLEYSIPRKESRIDAVLLIGDRIVILETKSGGVFLQAKRQIEEYALLLHYFHKGSAQSHIIPIIVSPSAEEPLLNELRQTEMFPQLARYWIAEVMQTPWSYLAAVLLFVAEERGQQIDSGAWNDSPYQPVPTIIEAAKQLRTGLAIRDIALSEASEHEIEMVRDTIQGFIDEAQAQKRHTICFLTGVPGSGKTLVGLSLAHLDSMDLSDAVHFMSGNGPLVKVLQHLFTQEGRKQGHNVPNARVRAKALIENVHVFARYYTEENLACPSNHAVIFDEAQRAWNRNQNKRKFNRDYSEPEMLLNIMERHQDWAAIIALVGGGQEINDGEAGLEEWGKALSERATEWTVYASPEVLKGGASTANHRLFAPDVSPRNVQTSSALHLRTSNRSLRAEKLATWVNNVLDGKPEDAACLRVTERFPVFLSRDLSEVRANLRLHCRGNSRFGLVGSSGAQRLRSEGLEPGSPFHAEYPWEHWYLAEPTDVRSSNQCEVFATEFEIQGLELDWVGVCWGGDFVWSDDRESWQLRNFRPGSANRWINIKNTEKREFRRNAYRVLLTRARQGMILFVPKGNNDDLTTCPEECNATADYLIRCGVTLLNASSSPVAPAQSGLVLTP